MTSGSRVSQQAIDDVFPGWCFTAAGDLTGTIPALFAEEDRAVANAVPKRRAEFAHGRQCARSALEKMGLDAIALPVGSDRAPIWPSEVVGSITHCDGFVGAVVASTQRFAGVGLDAEVATPLESDLVQEVCSGQDLAGAGQIHSNVLMAAKLVFCAKEAVFKAVYPTCGVWLNFGDVELTFARGTRSFLVGWVRHHSDLPIRSRVSGKFAVTPDHFLCGVVLSRE